jgi:hypothetical protein
MAGRTGRASTYALALEIAGHCCFVKQDLLEIILPVRVIACILLLFLLVWLFEFEPCVNRCKHIPNSSSREASTDLQEAVSQGSNALASNAGR